MKGRPAVLTTEMMEEAFRKMRGGPGSSGASSTAIDSVSLFNGKEFRYPTRAELVKSYVERERRPFALRLHRLLQCS